MELAATDVARPRRTRRFRSPEERCRIVEETLVPGVSVATVARAHELNANVVFHWRKLYRAGVLVRDAGRRDEPRLLPVTVAGAGCGEPSDSAAASSIFQSATPGSMEITFQKAQVRIVGAVDAAALRAVLECLLG